MIHLNYNILVNKWRDNIRIIFLHYLKKHKTTLRRLMQVMWRIGF